MFDIPEIKEYFEEKELDKSEHTITSYKNAVNKFLAFLNIQSFEDVRNVTRTDCKNFQANLLSTMKESSVNANMRPLKALFNWLVWVEYLDVSPFSKVRNLKQPKKIPVYLNEEEVLRMFDACKDKKEKAMIALFVSAGLRNSELINLKLDDIDENHILVEGKGSKQRKLALKPEVYELVKSYRTWRLQKYDCREYLFISPRKGRFTRAGILYIIKTIATRAGLPKERVAKIVPHSLRHTFTANLIESGADIRAIQGALGHASLQTTQIYAHLTGSALDNAMLNQKTLFGGS